MVRAFHAYLVLTSKRWWSTRSRMLPSDVVSVLSLLRCLFLPPYVLHPLTLCYLTSLFVYMQSAVAGDALDLIREICLCNGSRSLYIDLGSWEYVMLHCRFFFPNVFTFLLFVQCEISHAESLASRSSTNTVQRAIRGVNTSRYYENSSFLQRHVSSETYFTGYK